MISAFAKYANGVSGSDQYMPEEMKTAPEIVVPAADKSAGTLPADLLGQGAGILHGDLDRTAKVADLGAPRFSRGARHVVAAVRRRGTTGLAASLSGRSRRRGGDARHRGTQDRQAMSDDPMTMTTAGCCHGTMAPPSAAGSAEYERAALDISPADPATRVRLRAALKPIPGGFFEMGARKSRFPADLDSPRRKVRLSPYRISAFAVSNADFARFVAATGYRTVAEIEGWSFVFHLFLDGEARRSPAPPGLEWWRAIDGAAWAAPEGPGSDWRGRADHPAVHIAWYDAVAYCVWAGLRLPTEAEWETRRAGRSGEQEIPLGKRDDAGRRNPHEHLARALS